MFPLLLAQSYFDVAGIDDQYFEHTVSWIRDNDITNVLMLTFQENGVPLCKDGDKITVTNENKREYLDLLVEFKLKHEVESQLQAMRRGFNDVIPHEQLQGFAPLEVDMLLSGLDTVEVGDLVANVDYMMVSGWQFCPSC